MSDTGDLWWDMARAGAYLGKDYRGRDKRAVQDWVARHDVAHPAPRERSDGTRIGGTENRVWAPALKADVAGDTGLASEERRNMRILGPRLFEP
jgi:hypothetical protein